MAETRSKMLEALLDVPESIYLIDQMLKIYPNDSAIQQLAQQVEYALVDAIEAIIDWLIAKPTSKTTLVVLIQWQS